MNDVGVTEFVPADKIYIPGEHKYLDSSFGSVSWPHRYCCIPAEL